jgi:hypothetical protein
MFGFENYLMITSYCEPYKNPKLSNKKTKTEEIDDEPIWFKPEEEIYLNNSTLRYCFVLPTNQQEKRWTMSGTTQTKKVIMIISKKKIPTILQAIEDFVQQK